MDLLYGVWSDRTKAAVDAVTICFLIFYLIVLLGGGISSTQYALQYNEVSPTLWRPQMAPIKIILCIGIFLMLLQAIATLLKDVAKLKGEQWGYPETPSSEAATAANGGTPACATHPPPSSFERQSDVKGTGGSVRYTSQGAP